MAHRAHTWALLLIAALAAVQQCVLAAESVLKAGEPMYLFPLVKNGPNNQKRDIRNFLAMAKLLDRNFVLPGMFKHHRDRIKRFKVSVSEEVLEDAPEKTCFPEDGPVWGFMEFDRVLDRKPVTDWVPSASPAELQSMGWNGELDAVIIPQRDGMPETYEWDMNQMYWNKSARSQGLALAPNAVFITTPLTLGCDMSVMDGIKEAIKPYKYVGIMVTALADRFVPNLLAEPKHAPEDTCQRAMFEANRLVRHAPWIRDVAEKFVDEHMGGEDFLAVHVRPYPDECLDEWRRVASKNPVDPSSVASDACVHVHRGLHLRLGKCVSGLMRQHGDLSKLFVMAHPHIQPTIAALLEKEGVTGFSTLRLEDLSKLAGCKDTSTTFLSMVEEAIAVKSKAFLGTSSSSITQTIAYERMGLGHFDNNEYLESGFCKGITMTHLRSSVLKARLQRYSL